METKVSQWQKDRMDDDANSCKWMSEDLRCYEVQTREISLAITKLQEAEMWLRRALEIVKVDE